MKEFLYIFRRNPDANDVETSPEKMQTLWKAWQDWKTSLEAHNNFGSNGKRLGTDGNVVKSDKLVTNGPYVELKETVVGYMFVRANTLEEATNLAQDCPNIAMGGSVEVRPVVFSEGER